MATAPDDLATALAALSGQVILVTGGSGFIGSRICARAVERGAIVHSASRRPDGVEVERARREPVDVSDYQSTAALLRRVRPDIVLHLASRVAGARDRDLVLPMLQANLVAAVNVMLAAGDVGSLGGSCWQARWRNRIPATPRPWSSHRTRPRRGPRGVRKPVPFRLRVARGPPSGVHGLRPRSARPAEAGALRDPVFAARPGSGARRAVYAESTGSISMMSRMPSWRLPLLPA